MESKVDKLKRMVESSDTLLESKLTLNEVVEEDPEDLFPANPLKGISARILRRNYGRQKGTPTQNLRYLWLNWAKGADSSLPNQRTPCFALLRDGSWTVAVYDKGDWFTVRNIISGQQVRKIPTDYVRAWSWLPMMTRGTRLTNKYLRDLYREIENTSKKKSDTKYQTDNPKPTKTVYPDDLDLDTLSRDEYSAISDR